MLRIPVSLEAQPASEPCMKVQRISSVKGKNEENRKRSVCQTDLPVNQGGTAGELTSHPVPCPSGRDRVAFFVS